MNDAYDDDSSVRLDLRRSRASLAKLMTQVERGRVVTRLEVRGAPDTTLDELASFPHLESLEVKGSQIPAGVLLPRLERYVGPWSPSITAWSSLRLIEVEAASGPIVVETSGPVQFLFVGHIEHQVTVGAMAQPHELRRFTARKVAALDISGLAACLGGVVVVIEEVGDLQGTPALRDCAGLAHIGLANIGWVSPPDGLVGVTTGESANFGDRHPLAPATRELMLAGEPKWLFAPDERLYKPLPPNSAQPWPVDPFEAPGAWDLILEVAEAADAEELLLTVFSEVATSRDTVEDVASGNRAVAATLWLLTQVADGPSLTEAPDVAPPAITQRMRAAATEALLLTLEQPERDDRADIERALRLLGTPSDELGRLG